MSEGNPFLLRLRARQGVWGAFHHSNAKLLATAVILHAGLIHAFLYLGWEAVGLIFMGFVGVLALMAAFATIWTVNHQVRSARVHHTWDELLLTGISDRELVNGQLLLALRPTLSLLWLSSPALMLLGALTAWRLIDDHGLALGLVITANLFVSLAGVCLVVGILVFCLAVMSFHAALVGKRAIGRIIFLLIATVLALTGIRYPALLGVLFFLVAVFVLIYPLVSWYRYRVICCTLRERLLERR